jgi:hypothetical protein
MLRVDYRSPAAWKIHSLCVFWINWEGCLILSILSDATIDLDEVQIERDASYVQSFADRKEGLRMLIERRHAETVGTRLNPARTVGFERFPRFPELVEVADRGAIPHFKPGFRCNRGEGDFFRPQARKLRAAIRYQYGKLHRRGWWKGWKGYTSAPPMSLASGGTPRAGAV